ncbi:hypothetical protein KJ878_05350, partial [Patescibacteria group bacterium]|nr:hypothetical protein [Patescibacteria group bacterium]
LQILSPRQKNISDSRLRASGLGPEDRPRFPFQLDSAEELQILSPRQKNISDSRLRASGLGPEDRHA